MMDDHNTTSEIDKEERRRAFWSLYLLDRLVCCGRARPPAVLEASCHLSLPSDERAWRAGIQSENRKFESISYRGIGVEKFPSFAMVVIMASILSRTAQYMLQDYNIKSREPPWDQNSDYAAINCELLSFERHFEFDSIQTILLDCYEDGIIDQGIVGSIIFSHALFYLCHCLLNQPFLLRRRLESSSLKVPQTFLRRAMTSSREYSKRLIYFLRDSKQVGCNILASFYGYCILTAGVIQALQLNSTDSIIQQESIECLSICTPILEDISHHWPNNISLVSLYHFFHHIWFHSSIRHRHI